MYSGIAGGARVGLEVGQGVGQLSSRPGAGRRLTRISSTSADSAAARKPVAAGRAPGRRSIAQAHEVAEPISPPRLALPSMTTARGGGWLTMNRARTGATRLEPGNGRSGASSTRALRGGELNAAAGRRQGPDQRVGPAAGRPGPRGRSPWPGRGPRRRPGRLAVGDGRLEHLGRAARARRRSRRRRWPGPAPATRRDRPARTAFSRARLSCATWAERFVGSSRRACRANRRPRIVWASAARHLARDRDVLGRRPTARRRRARRGTRAAGGDTHQAASVSTRTGRLRLLGERPAGQPLDRRLRGGSHRGVGDSCARGAAAGNVRNGTAAGSPIDAQRGGRVGRQ